jgi:hypothetical protein
LRCIQPCVGQQPPHIGEDLGLIRWVRRHPVHDHLERKTPFADTVEDRPRDTVGVPSRGRDEEGEVGSLDETIGEVPVRMLDRVDVGRVDKDEPALDRRVLDEPDERRRYASEGALGEALAIRGVQQDDGDTRRRSKDAGLARRAAGDRVEDRALPGAGRSHEDDEKRGIEGRCAHTDMAGEVIREPGGAGGGGLAARPSRETTCCERVQPIDEGAQFGRGGPVHPLTLPASCGRCGFPSGTLLVAGGFQPRFMGP